MQSIAERVGLINFKAGTANSTPLVSTYINVKNFQQIMAVLELGDMANETIDFAIYQATDTSGTSAKALKASTQLVASATANDNKVLVIGVDQNEFDVTNGFITAAVRCVTGGATGGLVTMSLFGELLRYGPAASVDNAAVLEVKI